VLWVPFYSRAGWHRSGTRRWRGDHAQGELGTGCCGQRGPREHAPWREGGHDESLAWPWELERPAALHPRLGDHGKEKEEGGSSGLLELVG
jgi:hypothetical protein